jgi:hypothetical protein
VTRDQLSDVSKRLLLPLDEAIADLIDKSHRMDARRFAAEVERAIVKLPALMELLNIDSLADFLEDEMGKAVLKQMQKDG